MTLFQRSIAEARKRLDEFGLGILPDDVSFRVVRSGVESRYYKCRDRDWIWLDPADANYACMVARGRTVLVLHELGHRFADRGIPRSLLPFRDRTFGPCGSTYRRNYDVPFSKDRFVSRYAAVHPADDFAETFAFFVWFGNRAGEEIRRRGYGEECRQKIDAMNILIQKSRVGLKQILCRKVPSR